MSMFFFCKQKTAYERRISDWSSDVCSSDLEPGYARVRKWPASARNGARRLNPAQRGPQPCRGAEETARLCQGSNDRRPSAGLDALGRASLCQSHAPFRNWRARSEQHKYEFQSLTPISYAIFALTKKTHI